MTITFVTGNQGKYNEIAVIIPGLEMLKLDLDEIQGLDPRPIIEHKLQQASQSYPGALIVEDTSLMFNCLNGLPGTNIKWFEQCLSNSQLADLVSRYDDHSAIARSTIGYRDEQGKVKFFTGEITGNIVPPRGTLNPFGWNNIFQPDGHQQTFAEMTISEKNHISMRGQAAHALQAYLAAK
ncbi:MAG TPA: non-canonical purine NTP pyrophosphatase [Candidatus Saccharimonadia bacterium]